MIGKFKGILDKNLEKVAYKINELGIKPNHLTFLGLTLSILASYFYFFKELIIAVIILSIASFFDALDGIVARKTHQETKKGAFFDSFADRFSDFFPLFAIGLAKLVEWHYIAICIFGSMLPSFTRAKIEALSLKENKTINYTLGERGDRLIILILSSIFAYLFDIFILTLGILLIGIIGIISALVRAIYFFLYFKPS
jgi:Phosphatidylglycerophosphate synthase